VCKLFDMRVYQPFCDLVPIIVWNSAHQGPTPLKLGKGLTPNLPVKIFTITRRLCGLIGPQASYSNEVTNRQNLQIQQTTNYSKHLCVLQTIPEDQTIALTMPPSTKWNLIPIRQQNQVKRRKPLDSFSWSHTQKVAQLQLATHRIRVKLREILVTLRPQAEEFNDSLPIAPLKGSKKFKGSARKGDKKRAKIAKANSLYYVPRQSKEDNYLQQTQEEICLPTIREETIPKPHAAGEEQDDVLPSLSALFEEKEAVPTMASLCPNVRTPSDGSKGSVYSEEEREPSKPMIFEDPITSVIDEITNTDIKVEAEHKDDLDAFMNHVEKVLLFAYHLARADTWADVLMALLTLVKLYYPNGSMAMSLFRTLKAMIMGDEKKEEPKDTKIFPHSIGSELRDKWTLFKTHKMWGKFTYLVSAGMSLSVCSMKNIKFEPLGLEMINIEASKKQENAFDVIDAVVETFSWMHETGYHCLATKSMAPILYSDQRMADFHNKCDWISQHAEKVLNGNSDIKMESFKGTVEEAIKIAGCLKNVKKDGGPGAWLQNKYEKLIEIDDRCLAKMKNCTVREAPFGISLFGGTCVGKSTLGELTMSVASTAYLGKPYEASKTLTHDNFDEYQSTYTSEIEGVFFDDVANGKSQFQKKSPTDFLIKVFNNVAAQAIKAELNSKGRVFINFKVGVLTTNVKRLDAHVYSNCPESILRRFTHVTVKVKDKYCIKGTSMLDTNHPDIINCKPGELVDIWDLSIEKIWVVEENGKTRYGFEPLRITRNGETKDCVNLGLEEYLQIVALMAKQHSNAQKRVVERSERNANIPNCAECAMPQFFCTCNKKQSAEAAILNALNLPDLFWSMGKKVVFQTAGKIIGSICDPFTLFKWSPVRELATSELARAFNQDLQRNFVPALYAFIPEWFKQSQTGQCMIDGYCRLAANYDMRKAYYWITSGVGLGLFSSFLQYKQSTHRLVSEKGLQMFCHACKYPNLTNITPRMVDIVNMFTNRGLQPLHRSTNWGPLLYRVSGNSISSNAWMATAAGSVLLGGITMLACRDIVKMRGQYYKEVYLQRKDALPQYMQELKKKCPSIATYAVVGIGVTIGLRMLYMWNQNRISQIKTNSLENPEYNAKAVGWLGAMWQTVGLHVEVDDKVKTATPEQVKNAISSNICRVKVSRPSGSGCGTNMIIPQKFIGLLPRHVFFEASDLKGTRADHIELTISRGTSGPGDTFTAKVDAATTYDIPELDMCMVYLANCPDIKTMTHLLPKTKPTGNYPAHILVRNQDSALTSDSIHVTSSKVAHTEAEFYGGKYVTSLARDGACMAPIYAETKKPCVTGFHIGGNATTNAGVMQTLTQPMYDSAFSKLSDMPAVTISAQAAELPNEQYGRTLLTSNELHSKAHHMRQLPKEAYIDLLGSTRLRSKQNSQVQDSILTDAVAEVMGVPNQWGPPKLNPQWKAYATNIDYIADPAKQFVPSQLERARQDWLKPLKPLAKAHGHKDIGRPLTLEETICGIDGVRFIDAIPMQTSMGFPVFGAKRQHFTEEQVDGKLVRRPSAEIMKEVERLEACWRNNQRAYPVTTATLKDEPTKLISEKVRVFQAGPVAFGIHLRKYFLPVLRFLQLHPIQSESAVGINAFCQDWQELMQHVEKYAPDKQILGLDYSKYDVRMNSQITTAVMHSFIDLAQEMGYSSDDLFMMRMMIADLVHPLMDFDGTLIMAFNMNTSGNNLTVNINSTAGSLYLRLGFFHCYPNVTDFRSAVSAMTYGDDMIGSVKKEFRDFNFLTYKEFLSTYGIKITLPDKSNNEVKFLELDTCDFLKRKSHFIPEIGCSIGQIDEMSIFKSLHSNLKSSTASPTEVALACCDTALHEWFAYGREHYEKRREQLKEVCQKVGIATTPAFKPFDERVVEWKDKYSIQS